MKTIILIFIALIGLFTLLRNNVHELPGQLIWSTHPKIFNNLFLALLMAVSSIASLIKKEKINLFYLAIGSMLVDFFHRLSVAVNQFYINLTYEPPPPSEVSEGYAIIYNFWPSYVMGGIELILIIVLFRYVIKDIKIDVST